MLQTRTRVEFSYGLGWNLDWVVFCWIFQGFGWTLVVKRVKVDIALNDTPSQSYGTSHSVTCHLTQANAPRLTPAMQTGTRFTYPGGMKG